MDDLRLDLAKRLAWHPRANYPRGRWYSRYVRLAFFRRKDRPMPIP